MKHGYLLLILLGIILPGGIQGKDYQLGDFKLGEVLFGDKERVNDLKGKVVVIDFWGVQCRPCIAKMPHLAELDREYGDKGLRIIGAEMQRSSSGRISPIVKRTKVAFPITKGCINPIGVNRLPHMAIFDVDGKMVFEGYPGSDVDSIIKRELQRVALEKAEEGSKESS